MLDWLIIALAFAALTAAFILYRTDRKTPLISPTGLATTIAPNATATLTTVPAGYLPVLNAAELIDKLQVTSTVLKIDQLIGMRQDDFKTRVLPIIHSVAELVQMLPASEAHHHAQPGGLLTHALESAQNALTIRQGTILPPNCAPELIMQNQLRWSVAVLIAALLHDIGKSVTDVRITASTNGVERIWNPIAGSLVQAQAQFYRLEFVADRLYTDHQLLANQYIQRCVSPQTLTWLDAAPTLMSTLMDYLAGKVETNCIGALVQKADMLSVKRNLLHGSKLRFPASRQKPLIERTMAALKEMVQGGIVLPLNRKGAAGFVLNDEVWFVSKRLIDELRAHLKSKNDLGGFPGEDKNDRIFDLLQDHGMVIVNPMTNRAIWTAEVKIAAGTDVWSSELTLLRFSCSTLYQLDDFPVSLSGSITPVTGTDSGAISAPVATLAGVRLNTANLVLPDIASVNENDDANVQLVALPSKAPVSSETIRALSIELNAKPVAGSDGFLADSHAAPIARRLASIELHVGAAAGAPSAETPAVVPAQLLSPVTAPAPILPALNKGKASAQPPQLAVQFMRWVQESIASGSIAINTSKAVVHFASVEHISLGNVGKQEKFMLLLSPQIFRDFGAAFPDAIGPAADAVALIQTAIKKSGWNVTVGADLVNILRFVVGQASEGTVGKSIISCFVIREPERFVNPVPPVNELLTYDHELTTNKPTSTPRFGRKTKLVDCSNIICNEQKNRN
jgi:integrating conjugative element relaxase (TIGR03760 family)